MFKWNCQQLHDCQIHPNGCENKEIIIQTGTWMQLGHNGGRSDCYYRIVIQHVEEPRQKL